MSVEPGDPQPDGRLVVAVQVEPVPEHVGPRHEGEEGEHEPRVDQVGQQASRVEQRAGAEPQHQHGVGDQRDDEERQGQPGVPGHPEAVRDDPRRHDQVEVARVQRADRPVEEPSHGTGGYPRPRPGPAGHAGAPSPA
jgi:hypothetical protein